MITTDPEVFEYVRDIGRELFGKAGRFTLAMVCAGQAPPQKPRPGDDSAERVVTNKLYQATCREYSWPALQNIHGDMRHFERLGMVTMLDRGNFSELQWRVEAHSLWIPFTLMSLQIRRHAQEVIAVKRRAEREAQRTEMLTGLTGMLERVKGE